MKKSKRFTSPVYVFAWGTVVLIALGFLLYLFNKDDVLAQLPNYTQDKQKIVVDGFKYDKQPMLGSPDAKVKVIEFADFKCPACKNWTQANFQQFKAEFIDTGKVQFYFMNYAFLDRDSYLAGIAGEAVYQQSNEKFWEFYEKIWEYQGDESKIWATPDFLVSFVKKNIQGIDHDQYEKNVRNFDYLHDVKEDYKIGGYYGVNGTPTFFVNDQIVRSNAYEDIAAAINEPLTNN
jgi:protein-disulfide isomerase